MLWQWEGERVSGGYTWAETNLKRLVGDSRQKTEKNTLGGGDSMSIHPFRKVDCHWVYSHHFQEAKDCWYQPGLSMLFLSRICAQLHRWDLPIPLAGPQESLDIWNFECVCSLPTTNTIKKDRTQPYLFWIPKVFKIILSQYLVISRGYILAS